MFYQPSDQNKLDTHCNTIEGKAKKSRSTYSKPELPKTMFTVNHAYLDLFKDACVECLPDAATKKLCANRIETI
jgi:hypothetical protein